MPETTKNDLDGFPCSPATRRAILASRAGRLARAALLKAENELRGLRDDQDAVQTGLARARKSGDPDPHMASDRILETARKRKVLILSLLDDAYPDCLRALADRPFFLTLRSGDAGVCLRGGLCDQWRGVGVVGTRDATPEGKGMTEWFVRQLDSESDVRPTVVVSGLAYGIDIAAHRAALRHKLPTVAVMANGLDGVYPAEHGADADRIVGEGGALVSEVLPGDTSTGGNFVERNRIIAGLSRAVVAAQCAAKSGTLYTLRAAQDQGKAIYAVTYRDKAQSPGSEALTIGIAKTNSGKKIARAASVAAIEDVRKLMRILGTPPDAPTIGSQRKIFE